MKREKNAHKTVMPNKSEAFSRPYQHRHIDFGKPARALNTYSKPQALPHKHVNKKLHTSRGKQNQKWEIQGWIVEAWRQCVGL